MKFNEFKRALRQYFSFTRGERNGVFILCILLFLLIIANFVIDTFDFQSTSGFTEIKKTIAEWQRGQELSNTPDYTRLFPFDPNTITKEKLDSLRLPGIVKQNILRYRGKGGKFNQRQGLLKIYGMSDSIYASIKDYIQIEKIAGVKKIPRQYANVTEYHYFDPNRATPNELRGMGFNNFQIKNIEKYCRKGGVFKIKEDLQKIYGIEPAFYEKIKDWVLIKKRPGTVTFPTGKHISGLIELNTADSALLLGLKGIGPVFASRIIRYRSLLGGFYHKRQLLEVYNLSRETYLDIEKYLSVDSTLIVKLHLNFADARKLAKHPYLSKGIAEEIVAHRDRYGPYKSCNQLLTEDIIPAQLFYKIKRYVTIK
ncbi:MAG: helix-hairpin-helix domain-containing protein [Chlorobi bacterium]|nr:helix-hairpin-helix domain-containing protein [Chlorobiota bacterium]